MAVDVSRIPNNNKFDPVRKAILELQTTIEETGAAVGNGLLTINTNSPLSGSGTFTANQSGPSTITIGIDGAEYLTNITHDTVNQKLVVTRGDATTFDINLSQYIDDTNLARLISGTVNSTTGIATFTRDDATTFTVDFSGFLEDDTLDSVTTRDNATTNTISIGGIDVPYVDADSKIRLESGSFTDSNDRYEILATGDVMFLQYWDNDQGDGTPLQKPILGLEWGGASDNEVTVFGDLRIKSGNVASPTVDSVIIDMDAVNGEVNLTNLNDGTFAGDLTSDTVTATTTLTVGTTNVYDYLPTGITADATSLAANRLKLQVVTNGADRGTASFPSIVISDVLNEGYIPFIDTGNSGGAGSAGSLSARLTDSFLKINNETLEIGAADPVNYQTRYIQLLWQSGQNDKAETIYGAKEISATVDYLGGSATAKIGFTTGTGAGRVRINDTYSLPAGDGTSGQVLTTNGSGDLSWTEKGSFTNDINIDANIIFPATAGRGIYFGGETSGTSYGYMRELSDGQLEFGSDSAVQFYETDDNTLRVDWNLNAGTFNFIGTLREDGNDVLHAGNFTSYTDAKYLRSDVDDTANGTITFENGIRIGTGSIGSLGSGSNRATIVFGEGSPTSNSMYIEYDGEGLSGGNNSIFIGRYDTASDIARFTFGGDIVLTSNNWSAAADGTITAVNFVGGGGSITGVNATLLDSLDSTQFLRSDADDTTTGRLTIQTAGNPTIGGSTPANGYLHITDGTTGLGLDTNEIHSTSTLYVGTNAGDLVLRPNGVVDILANLDISPNNTAGNGRIRTIFNGGSPALEFSDNASGAGFDQFFTIGANDTGVGKFEIRFKSTAFGTAWQDEGTLLAEFKADDSSVSFPAGNVFMNNKLAIGTTTFTGDAKLLVGSFLSTGSSAVAQLNGFVRLRSNILIHNDADITKAANIVYDNNGYQFLSEGTGSTSNATFGNNVNVTGSLAVGTTSAAIGLLDVKGSVGTTYLSAAGNNINFTRNSTNYISAIGGSSSSIMFTTGGTTITNPSDAVMTLTSGRDVGIGTTSPTNKLHVRSGDNEGIFMEGTGGGHWFNFKSGTSNLWSMGAQSGLMGWYNRTDGTYKMVITDGGNVGIGTSSPADKLQIDAPNSQLRLRDTDDGTFTQFSSSGNLLAIRQNSTTASHFWLNSSGNVGLGTNSPSEKLDVQGNIFLTGDIKMQESHFINRRFDIADNNTPVQYILLCVNGGGNDVNGTITMDRTSGLRHACSVDIIVSAGSSLSPVGGLRAHGVAGGGEPEYRLVTCTYSGASYIALEISNPDNYYESSGAYFTGRLVSTGQSLLPLLAGQISSVANFESNSEHSVQGNFVVKDGRLGINVGNPLTDLDVVGNAYVRSGNLYTDNILPYSGNPLYLLNGGSNYAVVNGKLSVGTTTTTNSAKLIVGGALSPTSSAIAQFDGFIRVGGAVVIHNETTTANEAVLTCTANAELSLTGKFIASADVVAFSDSRVKENVETIDNALDKVLAMRGVSYNRTDQEDKSKKVGVIAQEIQKVLPEVVTENGDGMLGVSYGNIVGVLIEAIKELKQEVNELKAQING